MLMDEQFVAVFPSLVRRLGDMNAAAVLQTLWWGREHRSGEITMTYAEMSARTGLPEYTLKRVTAKLRKDGYLSSRRVTSTNPIQVWMVHREALTSVNRNLYPPELADDQRESQFVPPHLNRDLRFTPTSKKEELSLVDVPSPMKEQQREDVEELCSLLADLVEGNGAKRPVITKTWREQCRLMLDRDGRELDKAKLLIRWALADDFWSTNILSMPTFRKKYDQLLLKARAEYRTKNAAPQHRPTLPPAPKTKPIQVIEAEQHRDMVIEKAIDARWPGFLRPTRKGYRMSREEREQVRAEIGDRTKEQWYEQEIGALPPVPVG
jgi:hypothetical protein